jgi:hypothetical protein
VKDITDKNFGVLIAFVLPGFILLLCLSYSFPAIKDWLTASSAKDGLSVGGFLYATLASMSMGLLLSALRWASVDKLLTLEYRLRGRQFPKINFSRFSDKNVYAAFLGANENHYRYYQYYSNSLVASTIGFVSSCFFGDKRPTIWLWVLFLALISALFFAARDSFTKFYKRASEITGGSEEDDQRLGTTQSEGWQKSEEGEESEGSEEDEESG